MWIGWSARKTFLSFWRRKTLSKTMIFHSWVCSTRCISVLLDCLLESRCRISARQIWRTVRFRLEMLSMDVASDFMDCPKQHTNYEPSCLKWLSEWRSKSPGHFTGARGSRRWRASEGCQLQGFLYVSISSSRKLIDVECTPMIGPTEMAWSFVSPNRKCGSPQHDADIVSIGEHPPVFNLCQPCGEVAVLGLVVTAAGLCIQRGV